MPFKLIEASVTFQRHIIFILREVIRRGVLVYLNDILIISKKEKKYRRMITRVHELLAEADLHKKKKKCKYFQKEIKFLEFILKQEKIRKNSEKLKYIQN